MKIVGLILIILINFSFVAFAQEKPQKAEFYVQLADQKFPIQIMIVPIAIIIIFIIMIVKAWKNTTKNEKWLIFSIYLFIPVIFLIEWGFRGMLHLKMPNHESYGMAYIIGTFLLYFLVIPKSKKKISKFMKK